MLHRCMPLLAFLIVARIVDGGTVVTADMLNARSFGVGRSQITLSAKSEYELLSYNISSAGTQATITHWWITGGPLGNWTPGPTATIADYAVWRFYVDGESTASVQLQTSQAAFVGNADPSAPWDNDFFGKNSAYGGWHIDVPVPFLKSIRVTLQLPPWAADNIAFAMVRGVENLPATIGAFTLPPNARLVASVQNASLPPLQFHDLIVIPAGTPGLMLGAMIDMTLYGKFAGNTNSLEGCWHAYEPPTATYPGWLLGTGAEDYPESAYYFNAGPYRGPTSGLTVWNISAELSRISFYKLHHRDPVFFRDGFRFSWRNGDVSDPATGQKCTSINGNVVGVPTAANVTTLVYAYTW
eukprot:TRINITY_DN515_c0_g1_i3.p1 TRINITY_DN515_c0_g1~~TRINITY_DN515_c0_g1_i3.p1  ORF type:complete len:355 (-),score=107.82 TRINITY_DN515_c0_g1_i3:604-1668(-)